MIYWAPVNSRLRLLNFDRRLIANKLIWIVLSFNAFICAFVPRHLIVTQIAFVLSENDFFRWWSSFRCHIRRGLRGSVLILIWGWGCSTLIFLFSLAVNLLHLLWNSLIVETVVEIQMRAQILARIEKQLALFADWADRTPEDGLLTGRLRNFRVYLILFQLSLFSDKSPQHKVCVTSEPFLDNKRAQNWLDPHSCNLLFESHRYGDFTLVLNGWPIRV